MLEGEERNDTLYGNFGQDVFMFSRGDDVDRIADYAAGWDELHLDASLVDGTGIERFLEQNARVSNGTTTIDFGDGDRLIIDGATNLSALADDVTLI